LEPGGFYTVTPTQANYEFDPASRSFSLLGDKTDAVFTATPLPAKANPLDSPEFFVRQQYVDFLGREPEQGGLDYWSSQLTRCGSEQACIRVRRIDVSNAFFFEQEYQQTGAYVFRLYRAAYGNNQPFPNPNADAQFPNEEKKLPSYATFAFDRARVDAAALAQTQEDLASALVQRDEFKNKYPA